MSDSKFDLLGKVATHIWSMHRWQRGLFTMAVALLVGGSVSHVTAPAPAAQPAVAAAPAPEAPAAPAGRVDSSPRGTMTRMIKQNDTPPPQVQAQPQPQASAPQPESDLSFRQKISPKAMRIGASVIGGFLIGFGLRVFLRLTAMLLALGAIIMMGLSYFNVLNVDLTRAKTQYESGVHWAEDQAYRLKDAAQSHLPSSGSGVVGVFAGFKRRRTSP